MWTPAFACPVCRSGVLPDGTSFSCSTCIRQYERRGGILRFIETSRLQAAWPFLEQYRTVRRADGHGNGLVERFRQLPIVSPRDPNASEWQIRRESFETFLRRVCGNGVSTLRVLDVGAGNGWFSHRLATLGAHAVALDLDDDDRDGLGVAVRSATGATLVQADFDALPFAPRQFDVVVLNASLHYAPDPDRTLAGADRLVAPEGALVVMDSPMFVRPEDGEAMVQRQARALGSAHGISQMIRPGVGYLTFTGLREFAARHGRKAQFLRSDGSLASRIRRSLARQRLGRPAAAFGVWVAR